MNEGLISTHPSSLTGLAEQTRHNPLGIFGRQFILADPRAVHAQGREAGRILTRILQSLSATRVTSGGIEMTFVADDDLHDRLCMWGADREDYEDDIEEDEVPLVIGARHCE